MIEYTADELMTAVASRHIRDGQVCFVGIGLPSEAANLARLTHAPNVVLVYESGTVGAEPGKLPLSIGDDILAESAKVVIGVPETFSHWLHGGLIDVGFLTAAQIDRYANLNTTVIGSYDQPEVRLPGSGGAADIAHSAGHVVVVMRHRRRAFVPSVDFITSVGFGRDGRARAELPGGGPNVVITDLGVLRPDDDSNELTLQSIHPGVTVDQVLAETGWALPVAERVETTPTPTHEELAVLRDLKLRSSPG